MQVCSFWRDRYGSVLGMFCDGGQSHQLRFTPGCGYLEGILAIVHTAIGLTVHLRGRMWMYFFKKLHPSSCKIRNSIWPIFTGLAAALLFLMVLAISNDLSLRAFENAPPEVSPKVYVCGVRADSDPWHCLSIDREAPHPMGSCLCIHHGSGCCQSSPPLCPGSRANEPRSDRLSL